MTLTREKLEQAKALVRREGVDVWLTFVRETAGGSDPVLPLILDGGLTWQSALMVTASGKTVAVVGNYDADPLFASGDWERIYPYVQSIRGPLVEALEKACGPTPKIAVNFSVNDEKCDGLTHGMFLLLQDILKGTRLAGCLVSAENIVRDLRGIKSSEELRLIQDAIAEGDKLFDEVPSFARRGVSEKAIYDEIQSRMRARGLGFSWDPAGDPIVNSGPDSMIGHGIPSETITVKDGHLLHIDLGVTKAGYSSDIQRCWFVGPYIPDQVFRALQAVNAAISAGAAALRPGVPGHQVDAAARAELVSRGYPEYLHALGHQVGRVAHDGGTLLGPRWERYGDSPDRAVQAGEVYTLELGITTDSYGYLGLEEMVVVTDDGCRFLSERQLGMPLL